MTIFHTLSLVIGAATLAALWVQLFLIYRTFKADHERRKKQSTVEYVNRVRANYQPISDKIVAKFGKNKVINVDEIETNDMADIKEFLSIVEHLAAGVNIGIFDFIIIERMSGSYFLNMREKFSPYIKDTRAKKANPRLYIEFETMCRDLEALREKRDRRSNMKYS